MRKMIGTAVTLCAAVALLAACGKRDDAATADGGAAPAATPAAADVPPPASATAPLAPTQGNTATGTLNLVAESNAVRVSGSLQGLPPNGEFGFHIHEKGDCSAPDASSAGGHFNPTSLPHGNPEGTEHHAGDMLNLKADAQGAATVDAVVTGVSLVSTQADNVHGRAIVVHAKADDYKTQPSGDSGARIACGVIN